MIKLLYIAVVVLFATISANQAAVIQEFSRYNVILDRRPFGEAPSDVESVSVRPPRATGPSFADSLKLCAITECRDSIRVGFTDAKSKKTYFLFVGESEDGIEVVDADYEAETATVSKGGDQRLLRMGMGGGSVVVAAAGKSTASGRTRFSALRRRRAPRAQEQIEEERRLAIERKSPILKGEEYEAHMRKLNMALIRQGNAGAPPLPIALTAAEDVQLVAEGVLDAPVESVE
jgi:hypothetical protein